MLWDDTCIKAFEILGREPRPGPKLAQRLREAGFQDVQQVLYKLPLGPWPKDEKMVSSIITIPPSLSFFIHVSSSRRLRLTSSKERRRRQMQKSKPVEDTPRENNEKLREKMTDEMP